jgi:ribosome-associated protein
MEVAPHIRAAARRALSLPGEALAAECDEEFFVAGGPGGQHRNKTASGVRLVHRPTEVTVTATERRSQAQNRSVALVRLRERLQALSHVPKRRVATKPTRGAKERRLEAKRHTSERKSGRRDLE